MIHPSKSEVRPATILVDVQLQKTAAEEHGASLQELRQLVETLGWDIVGTLAQKMSSVTAASLIGPGKLEELSELVKAPPEVDSVVFDHELTTTQVRNIREATGVEVYDRPAIILEIFHRHARTKEAQLQVELARLKYLAPRERVSGAKERRGGGRGARGVSESFHEIERRKVRDRTSELQRELKAVHREQASAGPHQRTATRAQSGPSRASRAPSSSRRFAQGRHRRLHQRRKVLTHAGAHFERSARGRPALCDPGYHRASVTPRDATPDSRFRHGWFHSKSSPRSGGLIPVDSRRSTGRLPSAPHSGCGRSGVPLSHSGDERSARRHWGGKAPVSGDPKQDRHRRFFAKGFAGERVPRGHCDVRAQSPGHRGTSLSSRHFLSRYHD